MAEALALSEVVGGPVDILFVPDCTLAALCLEVALRCGLLDLDATRRAGCTQNFEIGDRHTDVEMHELGKVFELRGSHLGVPGDHNARVFTSHLPLNSKGSRHAAMASTQHQRFSSTVGDASRPQHYIAQLNAIHDTLPAVLEGVAAHVRDCSPGQAWDAEWSNYTEGDGAGESAGVEVCTAPIPQVVLHCKELRDGATQASTDGKCLRGILQKMAMGFTTNAGAGSTASHMLVRIVRDVRNWGTDIVNKPTPRRSLDAPTLVGYLMHAIQAAMPDAVVATIEAGVADGGVAFPERVRCRVRAMRPSLHPFPCTACTGLAFPRVQCAAGWHRCF
jgi:hypothetical protein